MAPPPSQCGHSRKPSKQRPTPRNPAFGPLLRIGHPSQGPASPQGATRAFKYLLDTNIISEVGKPKPHGAVLAWYQAQPPLAHAIPAIAIYEIQAGIERTWIQNANKAAMLQSAINLIMLTAIVLPLDGNAAQETARMMHGKSADLFEDAMIAATAKVYGLTVATRNIRDFQHFDVALINPFLFPRH